MTAAPPSASPPGDSDPRLDAFWKQAMAAAPSPGTDAARLARARQAIFAAAEQAIGTSTTPSRPATPWQRLRRWWQEGAGSGQRRPWAASFASITLASLVLLMWYERLPDVEPDATPATAPAATTAETARMPVEAVGPVLDDAAPLREPAPAAASPAPLPPPPDRTAEVARQQAIGQHDEPPPIPAPTAPGTAASVPMPSARSAATPQREALRKGQDLSTPPASDSASESAAMAPSASPYGSTVADAPAQAMSTQPTRPPQSLLGQATHVRWYLDDWQYERSADQVHEALQALGAALREAEPMPWQEQEAPRPQGPGVGTLEVLRDGRVHLMVWITPTQIQWLRPGRSPLWRTGIDRAAYNRMLQALPHAPEQAAPPHSSAAPHQPPPAAHGESAPRPTGPLPP